MEKLLPQNIEAECGVLGSIIIDPEAIVQVADFLHSEDFYRDAHKECAPERKPSARAIQQLVTAWKILRNWKWR